MMRTTTHPIRAVVQHLSLSALLVPLAGVGVAAAQGAANPQPVTADPTAAEGGLSLGYETMLREYSAFRPVQTPRPDTTTQTARQVAEAVARIVQRTAAADGVRRLEVDGLVVDQTITRIGREFYLQFYRTWTPPPEAVAFTVEVVEQPD